MKKRGKRIKWLLGLGLCVGILLGGCGKKEETKMPAVDSAIADDETPEVTIIDDNGGVVVNELLEEEEDPVSAELIEEEKESEKVQDINQDTEMEVQNVEQNIATDE